MSVEGLKNATIQLLFPKPVFSIEGALVEYLPAFEAEVHNIMNAIPDERNNKSTSLNVASSFLENNNLHHNPVFKPLTELALTGAQNFMKEMSYNQSIIDRCTFQIMWCNRSYGGDYIFPHNHGGAIIAGVFYIKAPNNSQITFFDDMKTTRLKQETYNHLTWEEYYYNCLPGTMLLFRNEQLHGNKRQPDGEKIAISFNIGFV